MAVNRTECLLGEAEAAMLEFRRAELMLIKDISG
jgi:hypothetical protein